MKLRQKLDSIIESVEKRSAVGSGELTRALFENASQLLSDEDVLPALDTALGVDTEDFLANASIAIGVIRGMRGRLQEIMKNQLGEVLPQTEAYTLVDLWGRALGVQAALFEIAAIFEVARAEHFEPMALKARMASIFVLLENILVTLSGELARYAALGAIGNALDELTTMVRAYRKGPLADALENYMHELPA